MKQKKKRIWSIVCCIVMTLVLSVPSLTAFAEQPEKNESKGTSQIVYENGIHYIKDPEYPGEKFIVYCMNNELRWPHHTEEMGEAEVPDYEEGYLTENDFASKNDYDECMRRLSKILYAGYPYNGERLYKIVEKSEAYKPTEEEFNRMLIPLAVLQTAFPELGHHEFTYQDWVDQDEEHLGVLHDFIVAVNNMGDEETIGNLTKADIMAMPFFKAAWCMITQSQGDPLQNFADIYGSAYFVTEDQAYWATQLAVWRLLNEYGIPDNNIDDNDPQYRGSSLGQILYLYSERGGLLDYKPTVDKLKLKGSLNFTYNPKDGMWHSGTLQIVEPEEYHGIYNLKLPKGVTAMCDNLTYIYGGEDYELVSDHQPVEGETFGIESDLVWLEKFKQYSPSPDIAVEGKKFQHMIGAVIRTETIAANIPYTSGDVGGLEISKTLVGETNAEKEFHFTVKLPYHTKINGMYGDLEFHDGVAEVYLKSGQSVKAENLPANAQYEVTEESTGEYIVESTNAEGKIPADQIAKVKFENKTFPRLQVGKRVTGTQGDLTKAFTFKIKMKNSDGSLFNGTCDYVGGVQDGCGDESIAPQDGSLEFIEGEAQISLSHGQQITLLDLPQNCSYAVEELDGDGYIVTVNDKTGKAIDGTVKAGETEEVVFTNHREKGESGKDNGNSNTTGKLTGHASNVPKTGDDGSLTKELLLLFGAGISVNLLLFQKYKDNQTL